MSTEEQLEEDFRRLDKDNDNAITIEELRHYYLPLQQMLGISTQLAEQEIAVLINRLDTDHNGTISLEEFKKFMSQR